MFNLFSWKHEGDRKNLYVECATDREKHIMDVAADRNDEWSVCMFSIIKPIAADPMYHNSCLSSCIGNEHHAGR